MRIKKCLALALLSVTGIQMSHAQKNDISLEEIWKKGTFRQDYVWGVNSMNDGVHYTSMKNDSEGVRIDVNNYADENDTKVMLHSKDINDLNFSDYAFSADEKQLLLSTETEAIYRHSSRSNYFVYHRETKKLNELSSGKQRLASFSPNGAKVAFVRANNLFVSNLKNGKELQITSDGENNKIINGATDWVYEEEFAFDKGFEWSPDGKKIAYYRFDESKVREFSMDMFQHKLYPDQYRFKYPKAGEDNSIVRIFIYDLETGKNTEAKVSQQGDYYIPRIKWTKDANSLSVQRMNRHQNRLDFILVDAKTGNANTIFTETDNAYIDITDNLRFLDDKKHFIWTSEKDGFNHIYLYHINGNEVRQITKGNWEVTEFYGYDAKKKKLYYQSTENSPLQRDVYTIDIKGRKKKRLSPNNGTNNAEFSNSFKYFINTHSDANTPNTNTLYTATGKEVRMISDSESLREKLAWYDITEKTFDSFTTPEGTTLNYWIMKPTDFDPKKEYPVYMYLYGGPGSQQVTDSWGGGNFMWYQHLTQMGYIVACTDNRGTGGRGAEFKKQTYKELGKLETEDQIYFNRHLAAMDFVDGDRIGIQGWSYGGYMSSLCLFKGAEDFKMAIAVAPVTNWKYYDSIYTERYMQTPQENDAGYEDNSPINHVDKLTGKYLLVHGSADDNVHYQNTMEMISALVAANKQFDLYIYPDKNHGIYGGNNGNTRLHLFTKMTQFIKDNL